MRTRFPRLSEFFTVIFEWRDDPASIYSAEESVGKFFDEDGFFDEDAFNDWMAKELEKFEKTASKKSQ